MAKKIKKIHTGSNMEGSNLGGNKANIKRVRQNSPNAPEYPPTHGGLLGPKRLDWGKKGKTPTGKGGSGSHNQVNRKTRIIEDMLKEGEGSGEGGALAGGATVFTSTNAGIFNPTYGGNGKKRRVRSKKKRTGIERLGVFLTDGSPEKKMRKDISKQLQEWVIASAQHMEALSKEEPPKVVEREGHPDKLAAVKQKDIEQKISTLDEASKQSSEQIESHGNVAPHIADVTLSKQPQAFGNPQDDELKRGSKKDNTRWSESVELELKKFIEELTSNSNQTILNDINIRKSDTIESLLRRI